MIECDCLLTVKQIIGRGKKNREEVFQYPVYYMFDKFSKKWWLSLDKNKIWIKSQAPEKDNKDEMVKSKSTVREKKNKTNENSKPTAKNKKFYRLLVKMVEDKNGLYKEMERKEADHTKYPMILVVCVISSSKIIDVGPLLGKSFFSK